MVSKRVGNEKQSARPFLSNYSLLHGYERQPRNGWSSKFDAHGKKSRTLFQSRG